MLLCFELPQLLHQRLRPVELGKIFDELLQLEPRVAIPLRLQIQPDDPHALIRVFGVERVGQNLAELLAGNRAGGDTHVPDEMVDSLDRFDFRPVRRDFGDSLHEFIVLSFAPTIEKWR